jgi:hypothetical protein
LNKNSGNFYELKFTRNSQENPGTLGLGEIWPASSWLHLIAKKNQFSSKEGQKFEFPLEKEIQIDFTIV